MKTKKSFTWALVPLFLAWLTLAPKNILAEEKRPASKQNAVKIGYLPEWISNGNTIYKNATQITLKHDFQFPKGLNLTSFNSVNKKHFTENDITLGYSKSFKDITFSGGLTSINPKDFSGDWEAYVGITANKIPLYPTIFHSGNLDENSGANYTSFLLSHAIPLSEGVDLSLGGCVGFNNNYTHGKNGPHNAEFKAKLKLPLTKELSLNPEIDYHVPLDNSGRKKKSSFGISLESRF